MFDYAAYAVALRRELEDMGIPYTEEYGRSGIVAIINDGKPFTIGIRADMDALPITEATGLDYATRRKKPPLAGWLYAQT